VLARSPGSEGFVAGEGDFDAHVAEFSYQRFSVLHTFRQFQAAGFEQHLQSGDQLALGDAPVFAVLVRRVAAVDVDRVLVSRSMVAGSRRPPSPEKLAANQANAQLSTGPKTPEGKKTSSLNTVKHGLTARELFIAPEDRPEFDELHSAYLAELQPQGILETEMFNAIVHAAWNLRRVRILEAAIDFADEQNEPKLARLTRYHKRFESTLLKCTRELRTLQSNRAARVNSPETIDNAPLADPNLVARAKRTHYQAWTDAVRAELGTTDLMIARTAGKVTGPQFTQGVPRATHAA
jgi:hypothetical protein